MRIPIYNQQSSLPIERQWVRSFVRSLLKKEKIDCNEVILHFVSKKKITDLHEKYFQDPTPTDCITFPLQKDSSYWILGEVFICPYVAKQYAHTHNIDPKEELALYIIHGLLHLLGYDDLEEKEERIMRKKEKQCMQLLKKENFL